MKKNDKARVLSKSKILAFRQCPKRLWLEIHRPDLREDSMATQASFDAGHRVGEIARQIYDPRGRGRLIDVDRDNFSTAFALTEEALSSSRPVFEAAMAGGGALALADVMLPVRTKGKKAWRMIEVKSSTKVKDYHRDDVAVQAFVAEKAGVPLLSVALAHVDKTWVYPGGGHYDGLLVEQDLTEEAFGRADEVRGWLEEAQSVASRRTEPRIHTGGHCNAPYACGFHGYCESREPEIEYPVTWLPRVQSGALKGLIEDKGVRDMRKISDGLLNDRQRRVKDCTLSGKAHFDAEGAAADLAAHKLPAFFLDFETVDFAAPIWKGTRPWQKIPFQFSVHRLSRTGRLDHRSFLDLSGRDSSRACAEALIAACGERGPVFVYSAVFERLCIKDLANRFPRLRRSLLAIDERIVDLRPLAERYYYHPGQQGSWSIKSLLPAAIPDLSYDALDGVQDGGMAMDRYREAILPETDRERKMEIERQLLAYCHMDTYAMVRLWHFFSGRPAPAA